MSKRPAETVLMHNPQQKLFVQTRKASKIARQIYLRTDIGCSSQLCAKCAQHSTGFLPSTPTAVLAASPKSYGKFGSHYLVPDTNIFYHCMDIIEQEDLFMDVIVLQTALDELRNKSLPLYNRLRQLVRDADRRFYVFHNDFHAETHIRRFESETINDRNDRAIRHAALWYKNHLAKATGGTQSLAPEIVFLTDDRANRNYAQKEGLMAATIQDYLADHPRAKVLLDMVAEMTERSSSGVKPGEALYPAYYSMNRLRENVKKGIMHQGIFNVSQYNFLEGSVPVPAFDRPVHILGRDHINRAIQGDSVVIEILPRSEWKSPIAQIVDADELNKNDNAENDDAVAETIDEAQLLTASSTEAQPTAKIVGIVKKNWRPYVGHVDPSSVSRDVQSTGSQAVFVKPMDRRIPKIRIRTRQAAELLGQKVVVSIDRWLVTSRYPEGHFVRSLGTMEEKEAETEALLLEWDVQYRPFPRAVLDCLPPEGANWQVPIDKNDLGWKDRRDLRDINICSIDPVGCQDIDDALHAKLLPNGNYEVGVHIADVSSFVKADTAMDDEAASRGTSVYMVDKRIDMLPMLLGTNLCSLMPYVERFAFSTIWELSPEGDIIDAQFTKSVIKSREAFSYEQAQLRIDDKHHKDELTEGMRILLNLSRKLRVRRLAAGALNLASPEVKVQMESETSDPIDVQTKQSLETNSLVEEFMLLANISVAARIYEAYPETSMLRRHGAPPASNFEQLKDILRVRKGLKLETDSSKALADSLDLCVDEHVPFFNTLVRIMATRCMLSAEYFSSGSYAASDFRHYGLASEIYTHFTSPIRRYADVIAHRQLSSAIGFEPLHPSLQNQMRIESICKNINYRHRMAQMAGRASVEYYVGQALKNKVAEEDAFVMKCFKNGFVVFVAKFGIEGVISLASLADVEPDSDFKEDAYEIVIKPGEGESFTIGVFDRVRVQIVTVQEASTGKRKVTMKLLRHSAR
jgi:exosome complex exonuclease DIS3/RRP44